jgi:hypothetical protein
LSWDFITEPLSMTYQTFRDHLKRQPFQPFRVVMSNGKAYEINQPELAWLTRDDVIVGVGRVIEGVAEDARICHLVNVVKIEPIIVPAP